MAPGARVLPFRVTEREVVDGRAQGREGSPESLAKAIRDAADQAQVINLSLTQETDDPQLRAAVGYAVSRDVVVVAAVGNAHQDTGADPPSYPAAYPGVLGVGAVDENGNRVAQSQVGSYVRIVAPGANVTAAGGAQVTSARAGVAGRSARVARVVRVVTTPLARLTRTQGIVSTGGPFEGPATTAQPTFSLVG